MKKEKKSPGAKSKKKLQTRADQEGAKPIAVPGMFVNVFNQVAGF